MSERRPQSPRGSLSRASLMVAAALLGLAVSTAPKAKAANLYWDANGTNAGTGGTGAWNTTSAFWSTSTEGTDASAIASFTSADTAFFAGTAGTVTLGQAITIGGLNFGADNFVLTGITANSLTLAGTTPTITLATGVTQATITALVAGAAGLTFDGGASTGTLTLGATAQANSYTGTTNISSGTLRVTSLTALGASGAGNGTVVNSGGALRVGIGGTVALELLSLAGTGVSSGGALILNPNLATTWSGAITIAAGTTINVGKGATFTTSTTGVTLNGGFTKTGNGTLAIGNTTTGAGGTVTINEGTIDVTNGRLVTSPIVINAGGRFLITGAGTNSIDNSAANTVNSGGTFDFRQTGTESMGTLTINGTGINNDGAFVNGAATAGGAITGAVTLGSNSTIGAVSGGSLQLITAIAGAGFTLTKEGAGTLRSNTVAASATPFGNGSIVLNAGTLSLNPTAAATTLVGANAVVGSTFTYAGGGALALTKNGANALTFTIGNAGAAANSVLVRSSRGTLVIQPSAIANLGIGTAGENFVVNANSTAANMNGAATAAGIYNASVVAAAANVGTFVQYQGANGFGSAAYTTAITATTIAANTISDVTSSISINTGSSPYALRVGASTLTISGTTTVNGGAASATNSGTAGIILNAGAVSGTNNAHITGGTLAFGSSEGVVFVATTGAGLGRISSNITGTAGLTKFGPGTLTLDGVNSSLSGGVQLNQGTIFINSATALGSGTFTIKDGTTFNNNTGGALTLTANNAQVWDGNFTFTGTQSLNLGTGAVTMNNSRTITSSTAANTLTVGGPITGSGTLTKAGAGQLTLSGSNTTLTGGVTLSGGTLNINNANALGTSAGAFTITAGSTINNTSGAAITNAANNPINFASTAALTLTFTGSNALNLGTGAVTLGGGALTLANSGAYPLTFGGNVGDNGGNIGISTSLAGVVTLAGTANTFTGTISITNGTLSMASIADSVTYGSGVGTITTTNTGATPYFRYTGSAVTLINRSLNLSTLTTGGITLDASGSGALALANTGTIAVGAGTKTIILRGSNTDSNILAAVLQNNSSTNKTNLTKLDRGQWVLTNNNTFTGTTIVNAGTLKLDASLNAAITPANGIIASTSALTLGGGTLGITGATGATTQAFASTALTTNTMSTVTASAGAGGLTVNLGAITRAASSGLNISLTSSPTLSYSVGATDWVSTNGLNVSATTGAAFMTLNGTDWANGVTTPVASTYTDNTFTASTNNINVTTAGAWAGTSLNTLRFNTAGAVTLTITNANSLGAGGILFGSGAGAVNFGGTSSTGTVSGTAFTTVNGELNIFNYSASDATINAALINNVASNSHLAATVRGNNLNVFGTGTTILNASRTSTTFANAYTGVTNISGSATLKLGQSNAIPFGTSTPGALSISGDATLDLNGKNQIINGISGLGMVNNTTGSAINFTIGSANGAGTFTGSIQNTGGGAVSLVKTGTGSITLNGQNTYTGATTISQGTLLLNFTSSPINVRSDILPVTALTLGSATLNVTGQVAGTSVNAQSFSGTTLSGGATITTAGTTPAVTINLGAITRNAGSGLAIHLGTSPGTPSGTFTTFANTGTSIMGGWAVQGATVPTTWAVSAGTGTVAGAITGLTTFATNDFTTATNDVDLTSNQSPATTFTINSLRFNTAGALTLTLAGTNTITTGGILVTATVGNNNQTIGASAGAGNLQTTNGGELIINNYNTNTNKTLTINSNIIANAATAATEGLTINGSQATPGTVSLRGTNTYAGPTTVNNAILNVNASNQLGSSTSLVLNNGTLTWAVDANQPLTLTLGAGGGTLNVGSAAGTRNAFTNAVAFTGTGPRTLQLDGGSNDRMWSLPGVIGNADATSPTSLTLNFGGDQRPLRLSAANTFTGNTTISRGILLLNIANALYSGSGGLLSTATAGNIIFTATGTNRAILETSILAGTITRSVGYGLGQIHWEGNGGFSNNSAATQVVNLGGVGATLTWGVGGFVPTSQQLQFGHNTGNTQASLGTIDFQNAVALGGSSRDVNVSVGNLTSGSAMVTAIMSGALSSTSGGGLTKTGPGILLLTGANSAGTSGATITIGAGTLMFANGTTAIPGSGANITFTSAATGAVPNGAVGVIGDTNPISTLGSRIANPTASTTTGAFVLGAHSDAALNFTSYPNMRLAAFAWVDGATPTAPTRATTYTGTITPANNVYQFGGIMHTAGTSAASTSLILGGNNQLTGARSVNLSFGSTTITANNDYTLGTTLNGNAAGGAVNSAIGQVVVGIASNSAFGTGAITLGGTQTWHFGAVNGDRSVSNNISLEGSSTGGFEAGGDQGTSGILANTNQGTLRYLGTLDLGGRSNPNIVGRPRATLFLGDITNGPGGINYTQGGSGIGSISWLTSANGGVDKTFVGKTTMGDNTTLVIDADRSLGAAAGELTMGSSTIQVQPGVSAVTLTSRNFLNTGAKNPGFNTPVGTTLTIPGTFSGSSTGQLVKQGPGTLVLSGNATAGITTGSMAIRSGTLRLDAATFGGTVWTSGQGLTLGTSTVYGNGGTLEITGTFAQSFGAVTVNSKANHINLAAAMALTVGTITRVAGSTLNFSAPTGTVASTHAAVASLVNGTTTFNGNDWAAANGTNITALATYAALAGTTAPTIASAGTSNYIISNSTSNDVKMAATGTINANTLKYSDSTNRTIDIRNGTTQGILRLGANTGTGSVTTVGGILVASGAGDLTIGVAGTPGTLNAGGTTTNAAGELVFINNSSSNITVNSVISNNGTGAVPVVYDGRSTGKLILAGANTFTGALFINNGILEVGTVNAVAAAGPLGQGTAAVGNILLNGGTFRANLSANGSTDKGFTVSAHSTIEVVANTLTLNTTLNGVAAEQYQLAALNAGILKKTGSGTLELKDLTTNANNTNLSIEVVAGTLLLNKVTTTAISAIDLAGAAGLIIDGHASASPTVRISGSGGNQISDTSSVVVKSGTFNGVLDLNSLSETIDGLAGNGTVTTNGTSTLAVGGNNSAGLSPYTPAAAAAGVNATGLNYFSGTLSDGTGTLSLTKVGSGTQIIAAVQAYSGATTIRAGTLQLGIANALPSGAGKAVITLEGNNNGTNVGTLTTSGSDKVLAPGTLDMGGFNQAINGLDSSTGGIVTNNPTLAYDGSIWAVAAGRQGAKTLSLGNSIGTTASFSGVIQDGFSVQPGVTATGFVGAINLVKTGTNTQTLSGQNTYSGTTVIQDGSIIASGGTNRLPSTTAVTLGNAVASGLLQLGDGTGAISQTIAGLATSGSGAANKVVGGNASNSTLILNQTGTSTYAGALGGAGTNQNKLNFTLQGGGTLTLNGDNTLAGTTTVQGASTLILDSNLTGSPVTVGGASAGTLVSNQTLSGLLTVGSGGVVAPGDVLASEIATLTLNGGLTLNTGGILAMQIGSTATLTTPLVNDKFLITGGVFTINGGQISLTELTPGGSVGAVIGLGDYSLIDYAGASNAAAFAAGSQFSNLGLASSVIGTNNYFVTLVHDTANKIIKLNVDNARFWAGATNGQWNTTVANWSPVNPALYLNADKVIFGDTYPVSGGNANVSENVINLTSAVTPVAINFNNSVVHYTLSGAGSVGGSTGLTKSGTASLTISSANTFTGNTIISGGYVEMQHATALGTTAGSISVGTGAALRLSGGISVGAKAISSLTGDGISSTGALRSISGNNSFAGAITLTGATRINSDADTLTLSGALDNGSSSLTFGGAGNVTVSGVIGSGSGSLVVDGTGVVTLSNAANTYTGQTFIKNGTLSVSNIGSVGVAGGLGAPTTEGAAIAIGDLANTGTLKWTGSSNESTDRVIDLAGTTGGATIDASGSGALTLTSAITATGVGAKSLTLTGTGGSAGTPNVISSGISDGAAAVISLIKTGTGVWKLDAASSYTGTTTILNGTLLLGSVNQNFSTLTLGGLSGGAATLALGSSGTATLTGDLTFSAANNPSGATISGSGTATLDLNAATRTFVVGSSSAANGADLTISAVIADALTGGALTKTGNGTLVLTGANTYAGATTVDGGKLSVSPQAIVNSLTINVGTNSTAGSLNFYADGAIGAVNLASDANLNIGGASAAGGLGFNLSGSSADRINLAGTGALTVGATGGLINARALASLTPGSFTLIDATNNSNTATITGFTLGVLTGGYSYALDETTGGQLKLTVAAAAAGPYYWTGARSTTSWAALAGNGSTSNWATVSAAGSDAGATPGNIDVIFTLGTAVSTTLDQPYSLTGLTFAGSSAGNGNVTINAGSGDGILTLGSNGVTVSTGASSSATTIGANVVLSSAQSWSVADSGQTLTVSGIISGNGNLLTKSGSGTLVLTGANTFNGGLTADAGTVKANNANSLGAVAGGLTLNNATLQATAGFTDSRNITLGHANSAISVDASQTLTFANAVGTKLTGSGVLNASGAGKLVLDDRLNANDFVGGSILSGGGTVQVYGLGSLGSGNITLNAATLQVSGTFTDTRSLTVGNAASAISVDSGQTLTVSGKITGTGNLNASGAGVLVLNDSVSANDFSGNSVLSGGGTVQVASLTALGTGSITINAATLQATGSLSYSGKNFILGNAASTLTVASADTFTLTNSGSTLVSGSGKLNANVAGILVLDDLLNPNTFSGGSVLSGGGTVKIKTLTSLGDETVAAALKDITLQATETIATTRNFTLGSAAARIAVDSTKTFTLSGNIVDAAQAGALTKTGPGVLELSGTGNTFTGGTTVSAGTLKVSNASGSATGTGAVTVSGSSTTLSGAGTITGTATIGSGSILSPGGTDTAGTLTLGGLTLASGSSLAYQLGANTAASDKTIVTGSSLFTANGGAITLTGLSGLTSTTYNLITYSGTLGGTGFGALSLASNYVSGGGNTFYAALVNNAGSVDLTTTNSLTWNGNIEGSIWDVGVTANTNMKSDATTNLSFFDTMAVSFGDTSTGYTVNIPSNVAPSSVIVSAANDYTFQGAGTISGSAGINKSGGGALVIDLANSFTGNIVLTAGSIEMKDPDALGTTGTIAITPGASLLLNNDGSGDIALGTRISSYGGGGALRNVAGNNTATLPAATLTSATSFVSDAGKLTLAGAITSNSLTLSLLGNGGDIELTGATFSGGNSAFVVTMVGGAAVIAPNISTGTNTVTVNGTGSTTFNGSITSTSTGTGLSVSSSGTNSFNGNVTVNGGGGGITLGGSSTNTFGASSNTTWSATGTAAISSTGDTTFNGTISGSGALTKTGNGALTFAASNPSYSGPITLNTSTTNIGTILAAANNALGTGAVTATYQTGATGLQVQLSGGITLGNAFTTTGAGAAGGISGVIRSVAGANILTGNVILTGGGGSSTYRADSGTSLAFNGSIGADTNQTGRYIILVGAGDFSFGSAGSIVQTLGTGGTTGLWSTNTGTTTINSTTNTYTQVTGIGAGSTLVVANLSNGGVSGSLGAATTASGNLLLDGGTLRFAGSGAQSTDRLFSIGSAANSGGGATLDASGATSADTLSFLGAGPIGFTGMTGAGTSATETGIRTLTLTGTNTGANTLTSVIGDQAASTGVTSVTKSGAGTWVLNGSNTYTGVTSVSNGVLNVQHANALGSAATGATTVASGATLQIQVSGIGAEATTINGSGYAGQAGSFVNVSGTNTYGGLLTLGSSATIASNGGSLSLSNTGSITGAGFDLTLAGAGDGNISASLDTVGGGLTKSGNGAWTLLASSSYAGDTTLTLGALRAGNNSAFGTSVLKLDGGALTSDGATNRTFANNVIIGGNLALGAASTYTGGLTFNGTVGLGAAVRTLTIDSDVTLAGIVSDGGLIKAGTGTLTLSGDNSFSSGTTISAGTVRAGHDNAFGSLATDALALNAGTLTSDGATARAFANNVTIGGNITIGATTTNTGVLTFNGTVGLGGSVRTLTTDSDVTLAGIVSDGGLTKAGNSALTLSGNNSFSGGTTVSAGTVRAGHDNAFGSLATDALALNGGTLTSNGATARVFANNVTVGGNITLGATTTNTGVLTFNGTVGLGAAVRTLTVDSDVTLAGIVSDGGLIKLGNGILTLSGENTFTLGTTITNGTITIGHASSLGTASVNVGALGTLNLGGFTIGNTIVLAEGATLTGGQVSASTAPTTGTLAVELTGSLPLEKTDSGRLELTGANTFSGATSVSNGTIAVSGFGNGSTASPLGITDLTDPSKLVIGGGATLEFTGSDPVTTTARSFTIADTGTIAATGTGALNFNGSSKIKLTGATPALTLSATSTTAVNRFDSVLDGEDAISTLTIDGVGIWVIGGNANRFKGTATFSIAAGTTQGATLGFDSGSLGYSATSLINVGDNAVLRWSAGNDDDISGRLRIGTGDTAKLDIGGNDVVFASAPKNAAGAVITAGTIEKKGAGTLQVTFSSPNLEFNVPTGKLSVDGTVGNVNLTSSGTILGGDGTVGSVTTVAGSILSAGNSPGTLTIDGNLLLAASTILQWEVQDALDPAKYDQIHVTGNLDLTQVTNNSQRIVINVASLVGTGTGAGVDLGAPLNFNNPDTVGMMPRTFDFMRVDGGITFASGKSISDVFSFDLDDFQYTNGGSNNLGLWSISSEVRSGDTYIMITAVPEPSTYGFGLGALALAAAAIRRRRKNQAAKAEASGS